MKAEIYGITITGTPEEIVDMISRIRPTQQKVVEQKVETAVKTPKERKPKYDWDKARSLKNAGWTHKQIAEELGCTEAAVGIHFKRATS